MEEIGRILEEINTLILQIKNDFPELYQFLEEEPFIISTEMKNHIDAKVLFRYRDNLKELVDHYVMSIKLHAERKPMTSSSR